MFIQLATIIICLLSTVRGGNLIRRGDFKNYGSFIGTNKGDKYAITPPQIIDVSYQMYPWKEKGAMSINYGKQHNEQWKDDDIVCQLNFGRNSNLSQVIVTESAETLVLKFRWAAMSYVELSASNARVLWNWQEILKITPNDTTMHTQTLQIQSHEGANIITFEGLGQEPNHGLGITNVEIISEKNDKNPLPNKPKLGKKKLSNCKDCIDNSMSKVATNILEKLIFVFGKQFEAAETMRNANQHHQNNIHHPPFIPPPPFQPNIPFLNFNPIQQEQAILSIPGFPVDIMSMMSSQFDKQHQQMIQMPANQGG